MSDKEEQHAQAAQNGLYAGLTSPLITNDIVVATSPSFAVANLMISTAQAQSRAMEASVAHQNQTYMTGLATATQCVTRILEDPTRATLLNAFITAQNN
jgi:Killing trait